MNVLIDQMIPYTLPPNHAVSIDTEWFGMDENRMHRPDNGTFGCMTFCHRPGEVYLYTDPILIPEVLERADRCVWTMHNAKFDITHLRRLAGIPERTRLVDTMMLERILWNGYYDSFGLDDLARRYLRTHLDKTLQKKWVTATTLTDELIEYATGDADVQLRVWHEQKKHITQSDWKIYKEIDLPAMWAVLDFRGFRLDVEGWRSLAENNKAEAVRLEEQLDFNPRSKFQVVPKLRERGFKGIEDSAAPTLEKFIAKYPETRAAKEAEIVLACREFSTFSSKYGKRWLTDYLETFDDGSQGFLCDYNVIGAETGRMSAKNPPLHQIPARSTKVFREKFIAGPGCKLIMADYSQQEIFIMAYVTQDPIMMEICNSGKDTYMLMAKVMFDKDIDKKDPLRPQMKAIVLGMDYGMSEFGLARKLGITVKEAAQLLVLFYHKFPGVAEYMHRIRKEKKVVQTVAGRKFYLNPYSSQSERNALNAPIQGTAADMFKRAVSEVRRNWQWSSQYGIVNVVHDEIVLDVLEMYAKEIAPYVQDSMVRVANQMCPGMSFRADAHIGDTWAEKE